MCRAVGALQHRNLAGCRFSEARRRHSLGSTAQSSCGPRRRSVERQDLHSCRSQAACERPQLLTSALSIALCYLRGFLLPRSAAVPDSACCFGNADSLGWLRARAEPSPPRQESEATNDRNGSPYLDLPVGKGYRILLF